MKRRIAILKANKVDISQLLKKPPIKVPTCKTCKSLLEENKNASKGFCSLDCHFWPRVKKLSDDECWEWLGTKNQKGYGIFSPKNGFAVAHRYSYTMARGIIPAGLQLAHLCDNTSCCNPKHMQIVTRKENMKRIFKR